jgi:hypothetical protein
MRRFALAMLLVIACNGQPGEKWAKSMFGEAGANKLRAEAGPYVALTEEMSQEVMVPGTAPRHPYIPRPYVVFLLRSWSEGGRRPNLEFHPAHNKLGAETGASEPGIAGIVVVNEESVCKGRMTNKGCRGTIEGYTELTLIDRAKHTKTFSKAKMDTDSVFAHLRSLPSE